MGLKHSSLPIQSKVLPAPRPPKKFCFSIIVLHFIESIDSANLKLFFQ